MINNCSINQLAYSIERLKFRPILLKKNFWKHVLVFLQLIVDSMHDATEQRQVWFVYEWQVKLRDPLVTHEPYLSALEMHHDKAVYKLTLLCLALGMCVYRLMILLQLKHFLRKTTILHWVLVTVLVHLPCPSLYLILFHHREVLSRLLPLPCGHKTYSIDLVIRCVCKLQVVLLSTFL